MKGSGWIQVFVLLGILLVAGAYTQLTAGTQEKGRNEDWLIDNTPKEMPGFTMVSGSADPRVSYRMGKETYEKLKPLGIVARVFEDGPVKIDSVVILGDNPDAFHDPTWCLPGQGWTLDERKEKTIEVDGKPVPVSYMTARANNNQELILMYTFEGPSGYHASITKLTLDMWFREFTSGRRQEGRFVRFLGLTPEANLDEVTKFAKTFLSESRLAQR